MARVGMLLLSWPLREALHLLLLHLLLEELVPLHPLQAPPMLQPPSPPPPPPLLLQAVPLLPLP